MEFAVLLPLMVFLLLGSLELANALFLRQTLTTATYEAVRHITSPIGDQTIAQTRFQEVLDARGVIGASVSYSPVVTNATPAGTIITATGTLPLNQNLYISIVMPNQTVTTSVSMVKH